MRVCRRKFLNVSSKFVGTFKLIVLKFFMKSQFFFSFIINKLKNIHDHQLVI